MTSLSYVSSRDIHEFFGANLFVSCAKSNHAPTAWDTVSGALFVIQCVVVSKDVVKTRVIVVYIVGVK